MSKARQDIFAAIRKALPTPAASEKVLNEVASLHARIFATRPDRVSGPPAEVFLERVQSPGIAATAERIAHLDELPAAVRNYIAAQNLTLDIAVQPHPDLQKLDWSGFEIGHQVKTDQAVAVGLALGGIAETGSLVFHSSPQSPTLFAFLPLHHIVAVRHDAIWPWLEDYVAAYDQALPPRNINLVTGASGTTDIEGALVRGAHGPGWLHIVLVGPGTR